MATNVIIADDHAILRHGVRSLLEADGSFTIIAEIESVEDLKKQASHLQPDIIILDYLMPGGDSFAVAVYLKRRYPNIKILIYTALDSSAILKKIYLSCVDGILLKQDPTLELFKALMSIRNNVRYVSARVLEHTAQLDIELTTRETQILHMILMGFRRSKIAEKLEVSPETIKTHRKNLMRKLDVNNITELVHRAQEFRLY